MIKKTTTLEEIKPQLKTGEELITLMEKVFYIIKTSIEETNPDERYLIEKLVHMNRIAEKMLDNLLELVKVSSDLTESIPEAMSREYSKVVLRKIIARIENINAATNSHKVTLARLADQCS
jgi:hypothetical protein